MKLYLISQTVKRGYDTYDSAVVCAPDEATAKKMAPNGDGYINEERLKGYNSCKYNWVTDPELVTAQYIGEATGTRNYQHVVCASFNAG